MACENLIPFKRFSFVKGLSIRNKLNLKKLLIKHLDQENVFLKLESKIVEYKRDVGENLTVFNGGSCFSFKLSLDFFKMHDDLRHWILWETETVIEATREVVSRALHQLFPSAGTENFEKRIIINLIGIAYGVARSCISDVSSTCLSSVQGILVAVSTPYKFTRSTVYRCKLEGCPGSKGRRFENEPFNRSCEACFGPIYEDVRSQEVAEETECLFNVSKVYKDGGIYHPFVVKIKDELYPTTKLKLGEEYVVVGKSWEHPLMAWGISERLHISENESNLISLPSCLSQLYLSIKERCGNSPWSFVRVIASKIGADVVPDSSYLHLKMGLLLGLVAKTVPILGVGSDTSIAGKLYQSAGRLADRNVSSKGFRHLGGVMKSGAQAGMVWHEAGPLILGRGGVCDLGDWAKYKKKEADYILRTIERGQIMLDNETDQKTLINAAPLECSVWTFWDHQASKKNSSLLKALVNVFGIPFLIDEKHESETGKICSKYLSCLEKPTKDVIPEEELTEYLTIVKTGPIIVTEAASELVKKYFVASRKERPDALPLGAIHTLTALSEAHARLSLRTEVLYEDVAAIIYLYQEAISDLFGNTPYDFLPKTIWEPTEPAYVYLDRVLQEFTIWLNRYVSMFASDIV